MTGLDSVRIIRYRAPTPADAQRAFEEDRERARAFGFVPRGTSWDHSEAEPKLVVEYRFDPREVPTTSASREDALDARAPSRPPRGLARAILLVGVILAGLVLLAVSLPAAAPRATSATVASTSPSSTTQPLR